MSPCGILSAMRGLLLLLSICTVALAQDVFIGGRADLEATVGANTRFDFGRQAGVDLTFSRDRLLDAYADISAAGGTVRLQELYLQLPITKRVVEVTAGRFLLPHGDPHTRAEERYAAGARDLFTSYRDWRPGNCLLDTDADGLMLAREFKLPHGATLDATLYGAQVPGGRFGYGARLIAGWRGFRVGGSWYDGYDQPGADAWQAVAFAAWEGSGVELSGQAYFGRATGGEQHGQLLRAAYRLPARLPLDLFAARTTYDDDLQRGVATTRLGVGYRFAQYYRAELRYEINEAPGTVGDDAGVLRLTAVF